MTKSHLSIITVALIFTNAAVQAAGRERFASAAGSTVVFGESAGVASEVLSELTAADALMRRAAGVGLDLPLHVFAVRGESSLKQLLPQYWEGAGVRPYGGSYLGPHAAFIALRADLPHSQRAPLLIHEYVHLLTATHLRHSPAWLDEGLAEFWSTATVRGEQLVVGSAPANYLKLLRTRTWLPLRDFTGRERTRLGTNKDDVAMFYAQSWAVVHYLLLGRSAAEPLAFAPADTNLTPEVEGAVRAAVAADNIRQVTLPIRRVEITAQVTPISEARSLAERAFMLVSGERPDTAEPLAKRSLGLDAREPLALEVLGMRAFLRNQPDEAVPWFTRALETDPARHRAALYLALLTPMPERERYLTQVLHSRPDSVPAWHRLWTIYREDGRAQQLAVLCRRARAVLQPWLWGHAIHNCDLRDWQ